MKRHGKERNIKKLKRMDRRVITQKLIHKKIATKEYPEWYGRQLISKYRRRKKGNILTLPREVKKQNNDKLVRKGKQKNKQ